jgi:hypothetical protein
MPLFRILALVIFASAVSYPQNQPDQKTQIREVRATGCVRKAQNGCLLLKTLDGKNTYTFMAAPRPDAGTIITIQGTSHRGATACKQGIPIDVTDWEPTDQTCVD